MEGESREPRAEKEITGKEIIVRKQLQHKHECLLSKLAGSVF